MKNTSKNYYVSTTIDGLFALKILLKNNKKIDEIITLRRESSLSVSDYADFNPLAREYNISIRYINDINSLTNELTNGKVNCIFVNGWSQLISKEIINSAKHGCVGTHPALLPKNRGRAPIAWHFINNEIEGGISLFYLNPGADNGPIIAQEKFSILPTDNASSYYAKITKLGARLLLDNFDAIDNGTASSTPQDDSKATYLLKRGPNDSYLDFSLSAVEIHNQIRAVSEIYPLAFFKYKGETVFVKRSIIAIKSHKYYGKCGQIAKITKDYIFVLTGTDLIGLDNFCLSNGNPVPSSYFKIGETINEKL